MVHVVNDSRDHDGETFELGNFRSRLCQFYVAESGVRDVERVREVVVRIGAVQFRNFVEEYAQDGFVDDDGEKTEFPEHFNDERKCFCVGRRERKR